MIDKLKFNEALKRMLDGFAGDLIRNTQHRIRAANVHSVDDACLHAERLVGFSPDVEKQRRHTKEFLYQNLYYSPALDDEKEEGEKIIGELFEFWMAKPEHLPASYQESANHTPLPRVICDYIAGMTDNYIYEQYQKYLGSKS